MYVPRHPSKSMYSTGFTVSCIDYFLSYTSIPMTTFNLEIRDGKKLTTVINNIQL